MTYEASVLTSWSIFALRGAKTIWKKSSIWLVMLRLVGLAFVVALVVLALVPNPAQMTTSKFQHISDFLRIFVGLLLSFFLTSSVNRWFGCMKGFLELFDAIRDLHMQLLALGVPRHLRFKVVRFGVVSGWLLCMLLQIEAMSSADKADATEDMWGDLFEQSPDEGEDIEREPPTEPMKFAVISAKEKHMLQGVEDPAGMVWIWVASLIGRMSQDGWIPPMASPTFVRIMNIVAEANGGIRQVKQAIIVQAPFIYVHMLASLVHVNNAVNAVSFGIVLGSTIGTSLQYKKFRSASIYEHTSKEKDIIADSENLLVSFVINMVGPFLYQSLLEIGISIAQPFASQESQIPTERLLERLQKDLSDAVRMASCPPSWEIPYFKEKPESVEDPNEYPFIDSPVGRSPVHRGRSPFGTF